MLIFIFKNFAVEKSLSLNLTIEPINLSDYWSGIVDHLRFIADTIHITTLHP